jgi:hypothetical protein
VQRDEFFQADKYTCTCGASGEYTSTLYRSIVNSLTDRPHHECACLKCKELFMVYLDLE